MLKEKQQMEIFKDTLIQISDQQRSLKKTVLETKKLNFKIVLIIIKQGTWSILILYVLIIMAFFDEQIFLFIKERYDFISQIQVTGLIALIALIPTTISALIAIKTYKMVKEEKNKNIS